MIPIPGRARTYTSGWPKNQKRFWNRYGLPPALERKKEVCTPRSKATISRVAIRTGAASTIRIEVLRAPQQKIGSRLQVRPGARMATIVAIRFSPSRVIEIPTRAKKKM